MQLAQRTGLTCQRPAARLRCQASAAPSSPLAAVHRLPAMAMCTWQKFVSDIRSAASQPDVQELRQQLASTSAGGAAMMGAAVLPFARIAAAAAPVGLTENGEMYFAVAKAIDIYLAILSVRVLLTWFRNINWRGEPFQTLRALTDPFLNTFRGIIPPIAGIDLSVMLGFFGLQFLRNYLVKMAIGAA